MPFTCMPEIVAQNILTRVSKEQGIPILTLISDEHTAEAGVVTRLEAFVDLLARQQRERLLNPAGA
jgi:benzoyl-CoA reductase/2-hydroxyglutaryl-CoA dehydratase subunit BcrC/BadD/HgdB